MALFAARRLPTLRDHGRRFRSPEGSRVLRTGARDPFRGNPAQPTVRRRTPRGSARRSRPRGDTAVHRRAGPGRGTRSCGAARGGPGRPRGPTGDRGQGRRARAAATPPSPPPAPSFPIASSPSGRRWFRTLQTVPGETADPESTLSDTSLSDTSASETRHRPHLPHRDFPSPRSCPIRRSSKGACPVTTNLISSARKADW